jgi:hypothetical protein
MTCTNLAVVFFRFFTDLMYSIRLVISRINNDAVHDNGEDDNGEDDMGGNSDDGSDGDNSGMDNDDNIDGYHIELHDVNLLLILA